MSGPLTPLGLLERESSYGYDLKPEYSTYFGRGNRCRSDRSERELTEVRSTGSLVDAMLADQGLCHLEADLRWIGMTDAWPDTLRKTVRP